MPATKERRKVRSSTSTSDKLTRSVLLLYFRFIAPSLLIINKGREADEPHTSFIATTRPPHMTTYISCFHGRDIFFAFLMYIMPLRTVFAWNNSERSIQAEDKVSMCYISHLTYFVSALASHVLLWQIRKGFSRFNLPRTDVSIACIKVTINNR